MHLNDTQHNNQDVTKNDVILCVNLHFMLSIMMSVVLLRVVAPRHLVTIMPRHIT